LFVYANNNPIGIVVIGAFEIQYLLEGIDYVWE